MRYAADLDLRKIYCLGDDGRVVCKAADSPASVVSGLSDGDLLLCEIASPVSFQRGGQSSAIMHQLARWALWNVATIASIRRLAPCPVLVAPSNVWTRGYELKTRHAIASCTQPQKDLRECETMLFFHRQRPQDWVPLERYLAAL